MWFALFPSHLSKVPRRSKAEDLMLQNATHLRKSMPWPPDMSDEDVSCTVPATQNAFLQILFKLQTSHPYCRFWNCYKTLAFWLTCGEVQNPLRLPRKGTIQRPKVVRTWCVLTFWLRHALCATAAGLFEEVNFQRCSDNEVFWTFWLGHVVAKHRVPRLFYLFAQVDILSTDSLFSDSSHHCCYICPYVEVWLLNFLRPIVDIQVARFEVQRGHMFLVLDGTEWLGYNNQIFMLDKFYRSDGDTKYRKRKSSDFFGVCQAFFPVAAWKSEELSCRWSDVDLWARATWTQIWWKRPQGRKHHEEMVLPIQEEMANSTWTDDWARVHE